MTKTVLRFVAHQLISAEGLTVVCTILVSSLFSIAGASGRGASQLLTGIAGFPFQVVFSFVVGFVLWRYKHHDEMLWVWVFPILVLCITMLFVFGTRTSDMKLVLAHFLGDTCRSSEHCFDQLVFTLPCFTSVAYALGAFLARQSTVARNPKPQS